MFVRFPLRDCVHDCVHCSLMVRFVQLTLGGAVTSRKRNS